MPIRRPHEPPAQTIAGKLNDLWCEWTLAVTDDYRAELLADFDRLLDAHNATVSGTTGATSATAASQVA